ncbi:MAG: DUF4870 domain-containing protein [Candidatus Omnitrophica bacterium]|nr:DUF4870 domain-containing protein [Candidatus Omnitrophota bacterium]
MTTNKTQNQERLWAAVSHGSALANILLPWVLGLSIVGPLVVWFLKKNEIPSVDDEAKEAINFQINMTVYAVIFMVTVFLIPLAIITGVANLILVIIASVKTYNGEKFKYPLVAYRIFK